MSLGCHIAILVDDQMSHVISNYFKTLGVLLDVVTLGPRTEKRDAVSHDVDQGYVVAREHMLQEGLVKEPCYVHPPCRHSQAYRVDGPRCDFWLSLEVGSSSNRVIA